MWIGIKLSKKAIFQIVDISRNFRAKWSTFGQEEKPILSLIMQLKKTYWVQEWENKRNIKDTEVNAK